MSRYHRFAGPPCLQRGRDWISALNISVIGKTFYTQWTIITASFLHGILETIKWMYVPKRFFVTATFSPAMLQTPKGYTYHFTGGIVDYRELDSKNEGDGFWNRQQVNISSHNNLHKYCQIKFSGICSGKSWRECCESPALSSPSHQDRARCKLSAAWWSWWRFKSQKAWGIRRKSLVTCIPCSCVKENVVSGMCLVTVNGIPHSKWRLDLLDQHVQLPLPGKGGADIIMIVERDTSHILSG